MDDYHGVQDRQFHIVQRNLNDVNTADDYLRTVMMEFKTDIPTLYNATLILSALSIPISVLPVGLT